MYKIKQVKAYFILCIDNITTGIHCYTYKRKIVNSIIAYIFHGNVMKLSHNEWYQAIERISILSVLHYIYFQNSVNIFMLPPQF